MLVSLVCASASAQELSSAIPSIGRLIDIRDIRNITAGEGKLVMTASHVYQTATKFFAADGSRKELPLNQAIRRQSIPLFGTYGLGGGFSAGAGLALANDVERKLSVFNFVPGATLLGQPLPTGQVTGLELSGSGAGDLNLLLQFEPKWFDDRLSSLLSLDVVAPTAESDPAGLLDVPLGQGFWTYRLSYAALREIFPMTYFVKAGYEINRSDTGRTAAGQAFEFDPGDGVNWTAGVGYAIGGSFSLQGLLVGTWRDRGSRSDQAAPTAFVRSADFRPGYTLARGKFTLTQQLSIPLEGRNALSADGVLTTVEYRF